MARANGRGRAGAGVGEEAFDLSAPNESTPPRLALQLHQINLSFSNRRRRTRSLRTRSSLTRSELRTDGAGCTTDDRTEAQGQKALPVFFQFLMLPLSYFINAYLTKNNF